MDKYLESLVPKGAEPVEEEIVTPEEVAEEEVVEEIEQAVAEPEEDTAPEEEVATEEVAPEEEKKATVTITAEKKEESLKKVDAPADEAVAVVDIRVFNTPDPKGPFKIFSGNIIVKDKVDTMTCIEYMKPGFGLVKGFTPDLK